MFLIATPEGGGGFWGVGWGGWGGGGFLGYWGGGGVSGEGVGGGGLWFCGGGGVGHFWGGGWWFFLVGFVFFFWVGGGGGWGVGWVGFGGGGGWGVFLVGGCGAGEKRGHPSRFHTRWESGKKISVALLADATGERWSWEGKEGEEASHPPSPFCGRGAAISSSSGDLTPRGKKAKEKEGTVTRLERSRRQKRRVCGRHFHVRHRGTEIGVRETPALPPDLFGRKGRGETLLVIYLTARGYVQNGGGEKRRTARLSLYRANSGREMASARALFTRQRPVGKRDRKKKGERERAHRRRDLIHATERAVGRRKKTRSEE